MEEKHGSPMGPRSVGAMLVPANKLSKAALRRPCYLWMPSHNGCGDIKPHGALARVGTFSPAQGGQRSNTIGKGCRGGTSDEMTLTLPALTRQTRLGSGCWTPEAIESRGTRSRRIAQLGRKVTAPQARLLGDKPCARCVRLQRLQRLDIGSVSSSCASMLRGARCRSESIVDQYMGLARHEQERWHCISIFRRTSAGYDEGHGETGHRATWTRR